MYGAILGDMIGAPYEFDMGDKTKDFPLFGRRSQFTDDTVMTIAVAEALMNSRGQKADGVRAALVASMQKWGAAYPRAGYGTMFEQWLKSDQPKPYGSFGNGSAMRVSSAGWLYDSLIMTRLVAKVTAEVTHNHPEGIKGAEAIASAIFLARTGSGKNEIRDYIIREFEYDLSRTCDEIRPDYHHVESCQETVPEAITAFLEGKDFEDVIRTAVSLGGDSDTLTCIAGSIAEAYYGVPGEMIREGRNRLPAKILAMLDKFTEIVEHEMVPKENVQDDVNAEAYLSVERPLGCPPLFLTAIRKLAYGEKVSLAAQEVAMKTLKRNRKKLYEWFLQDIQVLKWVLSLDILDCDDYVTMRMVANSGFKEKTIRSYMLGKFSQEQINDAMEKYSAKRERERAFRLNEKAKQLIAQQPPERQVALSKVTDVLLEDLDLSVRTYCCLLHRGIETFVELATMSEEELMKTPNLDQESLDEIIKKIEDLTTGSTSGKM